MEIFASMLLRPTLAGIEIEKRIITEEAREDLNEQGDEINPDTIVSRLLWPRHPLGLPTIGTLENINSVCRDDLVGHLQTHYLPNAAVVVVSGPVRSHDAFAHAEHVFGPWQAGTLSVTLPALRRHTTPQMSFVQDSDSQMNLQLAFLSIPRGDARCTAVRLIRRILAGGGSSRLYLRLREELGIIYSVEAAIGAYDETGCLAIDLSTAPETLVQAIEVTLEELTRITTEPLPTAELDRVRQSYIFDLEFSRDSTYEMGGRFGWGELMQTVRSIEDDQHEARTTSIADITATARTIFTPANLRLVAVGPWKKGMKQQVRALVQRFTEQFSA
jgi:predicted Zn-dependent peptidase